MPITLPPYENDAAFHSRQFQITKPEALTARTSNCVMAHTAVGTKYIWSDVTQGGVPVSADGFSCEEARKKLCQMYGMYLPPMNSSCHDDGHSGAIVGARGHANISNSGGGHANPAHAYASAADAGGCSLTAFVDKGNSPGWYTAGANSSGGAGWGGSAGHHHCDWKSNCCFCTDPPKCIKSNTPPFSAGQCRPDWGTSGYLGGGQYPANADFSKCPAGTGPDGGGAATGTTGTTTAAAQDTSASNIVATLKKNWILVVGAVILLILLSRR